MKSQQKILISAITALLGGTALTISPLATAAINLQDGAPANATSTYASEIAALTNLPVGKISINLAPGKASDTVTAVIPSADIRYVRIDLENGKFNASGAMLSYVDDNALTGTSFTATNTGSIYLSSCPSTGGNVATAGSNIVRYSGGASGQSYVIFKIRADGLSSTETSGLVAGCTMGIGIPSIDVTAGGVPVNLVYNIYSAELAAMNDKRTDSLGSKSAPLAQWASGLVFERNSAGKDATADVTKNFTLFKMADSNVNNSGTSAGRIASVGAFTLNAAPNVKGANSGAQVTLGTDIISTSSTLVVSGDFSSFYSSTGSAMFISKNDPKCEATTPTSVGKWAATTSTTAIPATLSFTTGANMYGAGGSTDTLYLCAQLDPALAASTTSAFQISNSATAFKVTLSPVQQTGYSTVPQKEAVLNYIKRDGATLESPYMSVAPGYSKSRAVITHLNPTGQDSDFFINLTTDKGNTVTQLLGGGVNKAGTIKKGSTVVIPLTSIFSVPTGSKPRVMASFVFYAQNTEVQGVIQHINDTTGEVTNIPMTRPGGRDGTTK